MFPELTGLCRQIVTVAARSCSWAGASSRITTARASSAHRAMSALPFLTPQPAHAPFLRASSYRDRLDHIFTC